MLASDIAAFCVSAGFAKVADDTVTLKYQNSVNTDITTPGTRWAMPFGSVIGQPGVNYNTSISTKRYVFKDPAGSCYIHLLFYTLGGNRLRDGTQEPTYYCDYYLSTAFDGDVDDHTGICKLGCWFNLPTIYTGMDMYSGLTSENKLWVHIAVEEKPMIFNHMGFGSIEKFLPFTGGDFITAHCLPIITSANSSGNASFAYCSYSNTYDSSQPHIQDGYYAPNLDTVNKANADNLYRKTKGLSTRANMEQGCSSLRIPLLSTNIPYYYPGEKLLEHTIGIIIQ
jgi:hypothetical protein